ncbi:MAG: VOC family protein [Mucilaginibacter polytrichastri]|nr:VOC family protein [Mucilaginibacter polytrichastri]
MTNETQKEQKITTFLWFDHEAEEAANFYVSLFKNSKIIEVRHYPKGGPMPDNTVMTVTFSLEGQEYIALNAGPHFKFNEAISLFVKCDSQEEVDHFWYSLTADGGQESQCGWLKDKYGLSWQIVPKALDKAMGNPDREQAARSMKAMMTMKKIDINGILNA